jgi:hypothetical protein
MRISTFLAALVLASSLSQPNSLIVTRYSSPEQHGRRSCHDHKTIPKPQLIMIVMTFGTPQASECSPFGAAGPARRCRQCLRVLGFVDGRMDHRSELVVDGGVSAHPTW